MRKADDCVHWAEETAKRYGSVDILVNCAAGNFLAAAEALSPNGFRTGEVHLELVTARLALSVDGDSHPGRMLLQPHSAASEGHVALH